MLLLGLLASTPAFGQTVPPNAPASRPLNPALSFTGGSCGTQFAPCPAISRLGLFIWFSGQYLGTGLGGAVDVSMEVASRVAVSASIPGALYRLQGQPRDELWGIGGPVEARARVRLGPSTAGFYSVKARPLWSSVIEVRTQLLIPGLDGDEKYVGRVQRGFVQPAVYGAGELNVWRFQFAPGLGILVGDRQAHLDLSLRASVQLLDRLFGDVEVLRRQALAVPSEPGRCQSAWMGAAGLRFQFRRGVFLSARYVGGQGDCVPQHSFMLNLGLAFGEGLMRIPTADELGFIKKWHATLMGMVDPVLDCQGIMRADDGTPMFRFGHPDARDPSVIWRNHSAYRVGEHFWEKGGRLYRDTDLTHPVLDLYGEAPLTFAERAAMHGCPTLPGLGSPCQVALNLHALRQKVARGDSPAQVALAEDAQILACLSHVSPLKAAAMFTALQAALGPLLAKLPQVARWPNPAAPPIPTPSAPAALAAAPSKVPPSQPSGPPKAATPAHPKDYQSKPTPKAVAKALKRNQPPSPPATLSDAAEPIRERRSREPEPAGPLCGTYCKLTVGAVGTGLLVAGGVEVTKDAVILGAVAGGESMGMSVASAAGGAVVGTIVADGVADHVMPPSAPTEPARPGSLEKPASSAESTARGESSEPADQPRPKRGEIKGDLTQLQKEATQHNQSGSQEELAAIEYYAEQGYTVEKLPESRVKSQRTPDLLVDGKPVEIKSREAPVTNEWIKDEIKNSNRKYKKSGLDEPTGAVDLRVKNQGKTDAQVLEQVQPEIERQFRPDQYRSVSAVRLFNEGRLLGEWVRSGGRVIKVFPVEP